MENNVVNVKLVNLDNIMLWDKNPKRHDFESIISSIQQYGFRDPPAFDETLGGVIEGNGRIQALRMMKERGMNVPRGIVKKENDWYVPVLVGLDAVDYQSAVAYAIDHNNLVVAGGKDVTAKDIFNLWDEELIDLLDYLKDSSNLPVSISEGDIDFIIGLSNDVDKVANNANGVDEISIVITLQDAEAAKSLYSAIQGLLLDNPDWGAVLKIN